VLAIAARLTAIAAAAVFAGSASAQSTGVGFTLLPQHVVQGEDARVAVSVRPSGTRCTLNVRYQGGTQQAGLGAMTATHGRAAWTWHVPIDVQAGPAQTTVRCARAGSVTRSLVIVGRLVEPKITVTKQGFSIRANPGGGTRLSYGLVLHNGSPEKDAVNVSVQTNFVLGDNNLLGTDSQRISGIPAGSDYALGRMMSFPGGAPITRLEVVVQVEKFQARALHNPTLANIHLVPGLYDPSWVGTVEGELQNTDPALSLQSADLSAVVFDAAGNVIGGGSGFAFQALPPGARQFIQVSYGLDAIPWDRAASTMVSMTSTWKQPGT
jgi:hypothetical protein